MRKLRHFCSFGWSTDDREKRIWPGVLHRHSRHKMRQNKASIYGHSWGCYTGCHGDVRAWPSLDALSHSSILVIRVLYRLKTPAQCRVSGCLWRLSSEKYCSSETDNEAINQAVHLRNILSRPAFPAYMDVTKLLKKTQAVSLISKHIKVGLFIEISRAF